MDEGAGAFMNELRQRQLLEPAPGVSTLRQHLQAAAPGLAPVMLDTLFEAMQSKKRVRLEDSCRKCGCAQVRWVEIPDAAAATNAAKVFLYRNPLILRRVGP